MYAGEMISPIVCVDFIVVRLSDSGELHDGIASFESLEGVFKVGQVCGGNGEVRMVAELGVFFGDLVDADDGMACPEGPRDHRLANEAITSSHCDLHHVVGEDQEDVTSRHGCRKYNRVNWWECFSPSLPLAAGWAIACPTHYPLPPG